MAHWSRERAWALEAEPPASPPYLIIFFLLQPSFFLFLIVLAFNCTYQQPLNNDFIYILNLGQLNAKQNADTFLCLNWMKVTAITTFNWAIFHYHILMTLHWQFACFWGRSMMESFISLFSYCLTTSASIKTLLYRTLIIFEWASGISVNTSPFPPPRLLSPHGSWLRTSVPAIVCLHNSQQRPGQQFSALIVTTPILPLHLSGRSYDLLLLNAQ